MKGLDYYIQSFQSITRVLENYGVKSLNVILSMIGDIQDNIFSYRVDTLPYKMLPLVEALMSGNGALVVNDLPRLQGVLKALLDSYEKKDYLLIADLLEFELKPLLTKSGQEC